MTIPAPTVVASGQDAPLRATHDAFLARLRAVLQPAVLVYDAEVPAGASVPYVVVASDLGWPEGTRLALGVDQQMLHPRVKAVGRDPREAQMVAEHAQRAVLMRRLTVQGRQTGPVQLEASMTVTPDTGVPSGVVWFTSDQYAVLSVPS